MIFEAFLHNLTKEAKEPTTTNVKGVVEKGNEKNDEKKICANNNNDNNRCYRRTKV